MDHPYPSALQLIPHQLDESEKLCTLIVSGTLAGIYSIFCLFYLILLAYKVYHKTGLRFWWQITFHAAFHFGLIARAVYFYIHVFVWVDGGLDKMTTFGETLSRTIPTPLFFIVYWIVVCLWAEIYHNFGRNYGPATIHQMRWFFWSVLCTVCTTYVGLVVLQFPSIKGMAKSGHAWVFEQGVDIYCAFVYFLLSVCFFIYGLKIYQKLSVGIEESIFKPTSSITVKSIRKVAVISGLCTICFFARGTLLILDLADQTNGKALCWLDVLYCLVLELFPLSLTILVLEKKKTRELNINK